MVRQKLGFAFYQAQIGQRHENAKMLHGFEEAVWQVRADDLGGMYRAVYVTQVGDAVSCRLRPSCFPEAGSQSPERQLRGRNWT